MFARFGFLMLLVSAMMAFQNCAQSPGGLGASASEPTVAQSYSAKTFVFMDDYGRIGTGGAELVLDVASGEIAPAVDSNSSSSVQQSLGAPVAKYCLDDDERAELEQLLNEDQVCAGAREPAGTLCSAMYRPAYAKYGSPNQTLVPVGEAVSGCRIRADFCSGNGDRIRQIVEQVKASLDSRACASL